MKMSRLLAGIRSIFAVSNIEAQIRARRLRDQQFRKGTPGKWRRGRDRSLGPPEGNTSFRVLKRAVAKGYCYRVPA